MAERGETIRIGSYDVKITRLDKVLFPDDQITKRDLINYYRRIAPWMLPHLRGRPLTLERFPDGIDKTRIIQKASSSYNPAWVKTVTVKKVGGTVRHVVCENEATLAYLANQACVTPHIWLSRSHRLDYPDQMVFDLDPSDDNFRLVKETAQSFRKILEELGLPAYLKTTGSRGLHVVVPLKRQDGFDSVRSFARRVAQAVVDADPEHRTLEQSKAKRRGRVFLDTNRNAYGQTVACAYAVRARRNAPVSVPVDWHELDKKDIRPDGVTIQNVFARLDGIEDPWKNFWQRGVILKKVQQKVGKFNDTRRISQKKAA